MIDLSNMDVYDRLIFNLCYIENIPLDKVKESFYLDNEGINDFNQSILKLKQKHPFVFQSDN